MITGIAKTTAHFMVSIKDYGISIPLGLYTIATALRIADVINWLQAGAFFVAIASGLVTIYFKFKNNK